MSDYFQGLVVFIDVLGTKKNTDFKKKYEIHQLWHSIAEETLELEKENGLGNRTLARHVYSFSDCAFYLYKYKDSVSSERKNNNIAYYEVLAAILFQIEKINRLGYLVRGGATLGEFYVDDKGCFGPAIEEAYKLETTACYPCIQCSDELFDVLYEIDRNKPVIMHLHPNKPFLRKMVYNESGLKFCNPFLFFEVADFGNFDMNTYANIMRGHYDKMLGTIYSYDEKKKIQKKWDWFMSKMLFELNFQSEMTEMFLNGMGLTLQHSK